MRATCLSSMACLVDSSEASGGAALDAWIREHRTMRDMNSPGRQGTSPTLRSWRPTNGDGAYYNAVQGGVNHGHPCRKLVASRQIGELAPTKAKALRVGGLLELNRATSYSPTHLRVQYHRG